MHAADIFDKHISEQLRCFNWMRVTRGPFWCSYSHVREPFCYSNRHLRAPFWCSGSHLTGPFLCSDKFQ